MIQEIFIISPTDVMPFAKGQKQLPSPQSQANALEAIESFSTSSNLETEKVIIVLGGNGHSNKDYLEQKMSGLGKILGSTESELIFNFLIENNIPKESIYLEKYHH